MQAYARVTCACLRIGAWRPYAHAMLAGKARNPDADVGMDVGMARENHRHQYQRNLCSSSSDNSSGKDGSSKDDKERQGPSSERTKWREWIESKLTEIDSEVIKGDETTILRADKNTQAKPAKASASAQAKEEAGSSKGSRKGASTASSKPKAPSPIAGLPRPHLKTGFSALGTEPSSDEVAKTALKPETAAPRIHPQRMFYPGQTYSPSELSPYTPPQRVDWKLWQESKFKRFDESEILQSLSFRQQKVLSRFVTDQGKILPRRRTRLSPKAHRMVVKAIKIGRQMALLPIDSKLPEFTKQPRSRNT